MRENYSRKLKKYIDKVKKWSGGIIKENQYHLEQNTIIKFIVPLFELLDWGPLYKDMEFEYSVHNENGNKLGRADIALYTDDSGKKPKILVEAKPLKKPLTQGTQIFKYLKAENINYGIYTNGKELRFIDKRYTNPRYKPSVLFSIELKDFYEYRSVLCVLSKNSVKNGKLDNLVDAFRQKYNGPWHGYIERLKFAQKILPTL